MKTRSTSVTHAAARQQCQSYGGDLVSIHSQGEQDFVSSLVATNCKFVENLWRGFFFRLYWKSKTGLNLKKWIVEKVLM